ncbi:MAG: hypothetical protein ABIJ40_07295 [Bacteroidota bacterium]
MRKSIFLLLISFLLVSYACKEYLTNSDDNYSFIMEEHSNNQYEFPTGVYYRYTLEVLNSQNIDEVAVMKSTRNNSIQIKDAWYKDYCNSCTPPGSNISMMVIVPAEFLILVDHTDIKLNTLGFTEISDPDISFCSYRVKHYPFN